VKSRIYSPTRRRTLQEATINHAAFSTAHTSLPAMTNTSIRKIIFILCIPLLIFCMRTRKSSDTVDHPPYSHLHENAHVTKQIDPLNCITTLTYDALGRLLTTADPLNRTSTLTYETAGNVAMSTDALTRVTSFEYDAKNRLKKVIDPLPGDTIYTTDGTGNLRNRTTTEPDPAAFAAMIAFITNRGEERAKQWIGLVQFERLRRVRQIAAPVFRHEYHVFDADSAQARIVEARLDRHDMAFLEQ
jgi:YD repeat-containing protein